MIETKFNINDEVYPVASKPGKTFEQCELCAGAGKVKINDQTRTCPDCYGKKGDYVYLEYRWKVMPPSNIGLVRATEKNIVPDGICENRGSYQEGATEAKVEYMLYSTGIGSGQIYKEENLFGTPEEAEAECVKKNEVKM